METSESIKPDSVKQSIDANQKDLGRVVRYVIQNGQALLFCERGNLAITAHHAGIVRMKYFTGDQPALESTVAIQTVDYNQERNLPALTMREEGEQIQIHAGDLRVDVRRESLAVTVRDRDGHSVVENLRFFTTSGGKASAFADASAKTHFYGLGEKTSYLDKQGESYTMWNTDVYAPHVPEIEALYVSIPFLIQFDESVASGLFLDNTGKSRFDMRSHRFAYEVSTETGVLDLYLISGPSLKDVVMRYTGLTGRMQMPPKWAIGYHQSRYSYMNQEEVLDVARTFREKQIPLDAIYLDIHYMDGYRVFTFDRDRFPDPKAMMTELREMGVRIVPIVDPGVKRDTRYPVYREGIENDMFCKSMEGDIFIGDVWPGASAFPDFTDDRVCKWWGDNHKFYLDLGVSGIWNDMNEPSVFNESKTMDLHIMHHNNGQPKTHEELHNIYGLLMSRATYQGLLEQMGGERPFVLTRAAYAGIQRYAAIWTGDNRSFWEHMAMAMPMVLNMGMSGVAFGGPDVGGFAHHASGELLARWTQMGAFFPFFRNHSALDTVRQEPWAFGEEVEEIIRRYVTLRYRLMPYLYSVMYDAAKTGLPIIRPLVLEYPHDKNTYNLCDEFLVGTDLLVAPVYRPGLTCRAVYLPEGTWVNYWTGERLQGERHVIVDAPLDTMPLFVRAGAVIPEGPAHQSASESVSTKPIVLNVYLGGGNSQGEGDSHGRFVLYEDDGHSLNHEEGEYNEIEITVQTTRTEVTVTCRNLHRGFAEGHEQAIVRLHNADGTTEDLAIESLAGNPSVTVRL